MQRMLCRCVAFEQYLGHTKNPPHEGTTFPAKELIIILGHKIFVRAF